MPRLPKKVFRWTELSAHRKAAVARLVNGWRKSGSVANKTMTGRLARLGVIVSYPTVAKLLNSPNQLAVAQGNGLSSIARARKIKAGKKQAQGAVNHGSRFSDIVADVREMRAGEVEFVVRGLKLPEKERMAEKEKVQALRSRLELEIKRIKEKISLEMRAVGSSPEHDKSLETMQEKHSKLIGEFAVCIRKSVAFDIANGIMQLPDAKRNEVLSLLSKKAKQ